VPLARLLWDFGRWLQVSLGTKQGKDMLELQLVYGVSGDAARNARFLSRVLEYNATVGNLSKIVLGDFNVNLDGRRGMPPEMQAALHSGQLVDVDRAYAAMRGADSACAFHKLQGGTSHIGGLVADPATAAAVRKVEKVAAIQVPGHDAVRFDFDAHSGAQRVRRVRKLQCTDMQKAQQLDRHEEEDGKARKESEEQLDGMVSELLSPYLQEWERKLDAAMKDGLQQDVNELWSMWTWLAEEAHIYMQERQAAPADAQGPKLPSSTRGPGKKCRGRGTSSMVQSTTLKPQRRAVTGGPMTVPLRECGAAQRAMRTALVWSCNSLI